MRIIRAKLALGALAASSLFAIFNLNVSDKVGQAHAQYVEGTGSDVDYSTKVMVSQVIQRHVHSLAILEEDIEALMLIAGDDGSVPIDSSAAFDNGDPGKPSHVHPIQFRKADLQAMLDGNPVEIASETVENHSHIFRLVTKEECTAIYFPPPTYVIQRSCAPGSNCYCTKYPGAPSCGFFCPPGSSCYCNRYPSSPVCQRNCPVGSPCFCQKYPKATGCGNTPPPPIYIPPSPSPTPTVTPSPTVSPSPSPSPTVSPSPSPSPTVSPSPSPSPTVSPSPSPSPTVSPSPSPSPSVSPSPSPSPTGGFGAPDFGDE